MGYGCLSGGRSKSSGWALDVTACLSAPVTERSTRTRTLTPSPPLALSSAPLSALRLNHEGERSVQFSNDVHADSQVTLGS